MNNINVINDAFKINTFQNLKSPIIICEDVFENPLQVREDALQKYNYCIKKAYGYICSWGAISFDILELFANLLKMNIFLKAFHFLFKPKFISNYPHTDSSNNEKKLIDYKCNDITNRNFVPIAGLIYLNPDIDKFNCTYFYETYTGTTERISNVTSFTGNRFNKFVIYDGSIYHSPGEGFGIDDNNPQDIRLVATYFIAAYT
jgi:hypothetical protein